MEQVVATATVHNLLVVVVLKVMALETKVVDMLLANRDLDKLTIPMAVDCKAANKAEDMEDNKAEDMEDNKAVDMEDNKAVEINKAVVMVVEIKTTATTKGKIFVFVLSVWFI